MLYRVFNRNRRDSRGFTLLELVMVMTIIVILASIAVTSYQQIQLKAKETILKEDLRQMRKMLDQFSADKERLPQSLEELVEAGYLREIPVDPLTENAEWELEMGDDEVSLSGGQGVVDVHSSARGQGSDGKAYSEYCLTLAPLYTMTPADNQPNTATDPKGRNRPCLHLYSDT